MTIRGSNEDINKGWVLSHVWLFVTPWIVACQYSCLENPMDGGAWWAAVHGIAKSQTWLSDFFHFSLSCIGEGNGNPLQCSCLENPRDGGAWWAAIYGVPQSRTPLKRLSSSSRDIEGHMRHMAMGLLISVKSWKKQISVFLFYFLEE